MALKKFSNKFYKYGETQCLKCDVKIHTAPSAVIGEYPYSSHIDFSVCIHNHVYCYSCAKTFKFKDSYPLCHCGEILGSFCGLKHSPDDEKRIYKNADSIMYQPGIKRRCFNCGITIYTNRIDEIHELPESSQIKFVACNGEHVYCDNCFVSVPVVNNQSTCHCDLPLEKFIGSKHPLYIKPDDAKKYIENPDYSPNTIEVEYILIKRDSGKVDGKVNRIEDGYTYHVFEGYSFKDVENKFDKRLSLNIARKIFLFPFNVRQIKV